MPRRGCCLSAQRRRRFNRLVSAERGEVDRGEERRRLGARRTRLTRQLRVARDRNVQVAAAVLGGLAATLGCVVSDIKTRVLALKRGGRRGSVQTVINAVRMTVRRFAASQGDVQHLAAR